MQKDLLKILDNIINITIPKSKKLATPIKIDLAAYQNDTNFEITLEDNSQAIIKFQDHVKHLDKVTKNIVYKINLRKNANLKITLQKEVGAKEGSFYSELIVVNGFQASCFEFVTANQNQLSSKQILNINLLEPGANAQIKSLTLANNQDKHYLHSNIEHLSPNTYSNQLYKTMADQNSLIDFYGKIYIYPNAIDVNAKQYSRNILLSDQAKIQTSPQLEIKADRVECAHGATIGPFDEESFFYLQSRGLNQKQAQDLLIKGFTNDIYCYLNDDSNAIII